MIDLRDTISGVVGSVCLVYAGLPFDTIKLRLQTSTRAAVATCGRTSTAEYAGFAECFLRIVREEGVRSLWKGAVPALSSAMIENAVVFTANGFFRRVFAQGRPEQELSLLEHVCIGGLSGSISATAICAPEVIKIKLQYQRNSGTSKVYKGSLDCCKKVLTQSGIRGLFTGLTPLLMRDIPFNALFFGSYRAYCAALRSMFGIKRDTDLSAAQIFCAGGFAGMTAWAVVFPFDSVKSKMQVGHDAIGAQSQTFRTRQTALHIARNMYHTGGISVFYRGVTAAVLRAFPANAALFLGYEVSMKLLAS